MLLSAGTLFGPIYIWSLTGSTAKAELLWVMVIIKLVSERTNNTAIRRFFLILHLLPFLGNSVTQLLIFTTYQYTFRIKKKIDQAVEFKHVVSSAYG